MNEQRKQQYASQSLYNTSQPLLNLKEVKRLADELIRLDSSLKQLLPAHRQGSVLTNPVAGGAILKNDFTRILHDLFLEILRTILNFQIPRNRLNLDINSNEAVTLREFRDLLGYLVMGLSKAKDHNVRIDYMFAHVASSYIYFKNNISTFTLAHVQTSYSHVRVVVGMLASLGEAVNSRKSDETSDMSEIKRNPRENSNIKENFLTSEALDSTSEFVVAFLLTAHCIDLYRLMSCNEHRRVSEWPHGNSIVSLEQVFSFVIRELKCSHACGLFSNPKTYGTIVMKEIYIRSRTFMHAFGLVLQIKIAEAERCSDLEEANTDPFKMSPLYVANILAAAAELAWYSSAYIHTNIFNPSARNSFLVYKTEFIENSGFPSNFFGSISNGSAPNFNAADSSLSMFHDFFSRILQEDDALGKQGLVCLNEFLKQVRIRIRETKRKYGDGNPDLGESDNDGRFHEYICTSICSALVDRVKVEFHQNSARTSTYTLELLKLYLSILLELRMYFKVKQPRYRLGAPIHREHLGRAYETLEQFVSTGCLIFRKAALAIQRAQAGTKRHEMWLQVIAQTFDVFADDKEMWSRAFHVTDDGFENSNLHDSFKGKGKLSLINAVAIVRCATWISSLSNTNLEESFTTVLSIFASLECLAESKHFLEVETVHLDFVPVSKSTSLSEPSFGEGEISPGMFEYTISVFIGRLLLLHYIRLVKAAYPPSGSMPSFDERSITEQPQSKNSRLHGAKYVRVIENKLSYLLPIFSMRCARAYANVRIQIPSNALTVFVTLLSVVLGSERDHLATASVQALSVFLDILLETSLSDNQSQQLRLRPTLDIIMYRFAEIWHFLYANGSLPKWTVAYPYTNINTSSGEKFLEPELLSFFVRDIIKTFRKKNLKSFKENTTPFRSFHPKIALIHLERVKASAEKSIRKGILPGGVSRSSPSVDMGMRTYVLRRLDVLVNLLRSFAILFKWQRSLHAQSIHLDFDFDLNRLKLGDSSSKRKPKSSSSSSSRLKNSDGAISNVAIALQNIMDFFWTVQSVRGHVIAAHYALLLATNSKHSNDAWEAGNAYIMTANTLTSKIIRNCPSSEIVLSKTDGLGDLITVLLNEAMLLFKKVRAVSELNRVRAALKLEEKPDRDLESAVATSFYFLIGTCGDFEYTDVSVMPKLSLIRLVRKAFPSSVGDGEDHNKYESEVIERIQQMTGLRYADGSLQWNCDDVWVNEPLSTNATCKKTVSYVFTENRESQAAARYLRKAIEMKPIYGQDGDSTTEFRNGMESVAATLGNGIFWVRRLWPVKPKGRQLEVEMNEEENAKENNNFYIDVTGVGINQSELARCPESFVLLPDEQDLSQYSENWNAVGEVSYVKVPRKRQSNSYDKSVTTRLRNELVENHRLGESRPITLDRVVFQVSRICGLSAFVSITSIEPKLLIPSEKPLSELLTKSVYGMPVSLEGDSIGPSPTNLPLPEPSFTSEKDEVDDVIIAPPPDFPPPPKHYLPDPGQSIFTEEVVILPPPYSPTNNSKDNLNDDHDQSEVVILLPPDEPGVPHETVENETEDKIILPPPVVEVPNERPGSNLGENDKESKEMLNLQPADLVPADVNDREPDKSEPGPIRPPGPPPSAPEDLPPPPPTFAPPSPPPFTPSDEISDGENEDNSPEPQYSETETTRDKVPSPTNDISVSDEEDDVAIGHSETMNGLVDDMGVNASEPIPPEGRVAPQVRGRREAFIHPVPDSKTEVPEMKAVDPPTTEDLGCLAGDDEEFEMCYGLRLSKDDAKIIDTFIREGEAWFPCEIVEKWGVRNVFVRIISPTPGVRTEGLLPFLEVRAGKTRMSKILHKYSLDKDVTTVEECTNPLIVQVISMEKQEPLLLKPENPALLIATFRGLRV